MLPALSKSYAPKKPDIFTMKTILVLLLLAIAQQTSAQIKSVPITAGEVPKSINFEGKFVKGFQFTDAAGEHLFLAAETGVINSKVENDEDYFRSAMLYAYQFDLKNEKWEQQWRVIDFEKDCALDVSAAFTRDALLITDLNNNGKAEVWLMYKIACRGDVSPSNLKIIMYEDGKKYAMRGQSFVKLSAAETYGGKYALDQAFKTGPKVFVQYAEKLWGKYKLEDFK
jgi:hypothetical protein